MRKGMKSYILNKDVRYVFITLWRELFLPMRLPEGNDDGRRRRNRCLVLLPVGCRPTATKQWVIVKVVVRI